MLRFELARRALRPCLRRTLSSRPRTRSLITTPIFYANGAPHIGHAYSVVLADFYARAARLSQFDLPELAARGSVVTLTSGTDEHGFKVARAAAALAVPPLELCNQLSAQFRASFSRLFVQPDEFIRTTAPRHARVVDALWRRLHRRGFISLSVYSGWYCVADEAFVAPADVVARPDPADASRQIHVSRDSGNVVERLDEPTYVFDLPRVRDAVRAWLNSTPAPIRPAERLHEALAMLDSPAAAVPLSISRPRTRVAWGLPVPGDDSHTIYVWLDALSNYLTALSADADAIVARLDDDKDNLAKLGWPATMHVIGKDILRFHAVFWPAFLIAAGLRPPSELLVHAWWTTPSGEKVSKSKGNVTHSLADLLDRYEPDALRYFLLRHGGLVNDSEFSERLLWKCRNAELVDRLGNLLSRLTAANLLPNQVWPAACSTSTVVHQATATAVEAVFAAVAARRASDALEAVSVLLRAVNTYVDQEQPWRIDDAARKAHVMRAALDGLHAALVLLQPAMPATCTRALDFLGIEDCSWRQNAGAFVLQSGGVVCGGAGVQFGSTPVLFPRMASSKQQ